MGARAYEPAGGWVNPRTTKAESCAGTARRGALVGVCWLFCQGVRSAAALMIRLNDILEKVSAYHADADLDLIKKAYVYSAKVHQGQIRKSGEPYLVHPLEVAGLLADLKLDEASIVSGLLHDTIEDTLAKPEEIRELFGQEVLDLVEGVTKLGTFQSSQAVSIEEKQAENFRKMLVAMAKDIRVILVKLADRTHNMRTLEHMRPDAQQRIAQETLDIYAPLANRLGIQWVKIELEDLAFKYLKPGDELLPILLALREPEGSAEVHRRRRRPASDQAAGGGPRGRGPRPAQARLQHLEEDAEARPLLGDPAPRRGRLPPHPQDRAGLLRGVGAHPLALEAGAGAVQGLHRDPQAQHVPVAAHHGHRAHRRAHRDPDAHRGDAPDCRGRHRGALGLQGRQERRQGRAEVRLAPPADGVAAGPEGPARVPGDGQGGPLPGRGLRVHAQGRREEPAARIHAGRPRLRGPLGD